MKVPRLLLLSYQKSLKFLAKPILVDVITIDNLTVDTRQHYINPLSKASKPSLDKTAAKVAAVYSTATVSASDLNKQVDNQFSRNT
ncbi:hypothetical protein INT48_003138 [Thamnidium elegans]|uniref:Uncharacterized protein n=1 Tax=Thamnidium elegans TaxID=101142 RepID=A0A8H7SIK7_9FUNG|nr:hypothetical protein INT48_003138 [Thamnidium elegans]